MAGGGLGGRTRTTARRMCSTKRLPCSLSVPKLNFRQLTAPRTARSATLFVPGGEHDGEEGGLVPHGKVTDGRAKD